jgi:hypothetical protein
MAILQSSRLAPRSALLPRGANALTLSIRMMADPIFFSSSLGSIGRPDDAGYAL